jgi:carbamoyl-phosphate synthase small subunit
VTVYPADTPATTLLAERPDGIVLSPGPGDPRMLPIMAEETSRLIGKAPILGICLGHQLVARALGAGTFKLPFGHRGGNHPVKDLKTGRVTITAQNHGYAVDPEGLAASAEVSRINLNDGTVEGLAMRDEPLLTIQYHSEASPGPLDSTGIFDEFVAMMMAGGKTR